MKKKMISMLLALCMSLSVCACGKTEATDNNVGTIAEENGQKTDGKAVLNNPAGITLQNPNAVKGDKLLYQLGNGVVVFDVKALEVQLIKDSDYEFKIPGQVTWMRFQTGVSAAAYIHDNREESAFCDIVLADEEEKSTYIEGMERVYVEDGIFYTNDDRWLRMYADAGEGDYILLCCDADGDVDEEFIEEFEKDAELVLEYVDVCPNATVLSEDAVSVKGEKYDLSKYPVWQDVFTLALCETWGINLQDSNNFISFCTEEPFTINLDDVTLFFDDYHVADDWQWVDEDKNFRMETDKILIEAVMAEGAVTTIKLTTIMDDYPLMLYCKGFTKEGVTDSEENLRAFFSKFFQ